ncbi:MAG: hypothetical protein ACP5JC_01120 [Candidatus Micrarchaeia archaeon]
MGNRHLATTSLARVKVKDLNTVKSFLIHHLTQLVKHEDPIPLDYPYPRDLDDWLRLSQERVFYFFMSSGIPRASAFVIPPSFRRMVFNYNEKEEVEFKTICYPELTGVFVQPEFRGRGIVGKFLSLALEDYEEIIVLPKLKTKAEEAGISLLSSLVGIPFNELRRTLHYSDEASVLEPLILRDVPPDSMDKIRELVGQVDDSSIPMEVAAKNRGMFIGYSFPWLGPVYLLTREQ